MAGGVTFSNPYALALLILLPLIAWLGWPSAGWGRGRAWVSLGLRQAIVLCLVLGLAGAQMRRPSDDLAVVFLVDGSDSMPEASRTAAEAYVRDALQSMGPQDQAAVVVFGANALVERPMSSARELAPMASAPVRLHTDLAEAIRLGLALYPPGTARRMVILSDGAATTGDAEAAARLAQASGVQIVGVPFAVQSGPEALVESVDAPSRLRPHESFGLRIVLHATEPMRARLRVLAGPTVVHDSRPELRAGSNALVVPLVATAPGFTTYRVLLAPERDGFYQNNEMSAFSYVTGPPQALIVAPASGSPMGVDVRPDEHSALAAALQAAGVQTDVVLPTSLPSELVALANYSSVILVDVPARDLSVRQMEAVQGYVRDLGGGLVVVGGPTSYGVGGYYRTPLEEALPVSMALQDEQRRPSLAIVFIVDTSGSMADVSGGPTKIELAKDAVVRSIDLLMPTDRVGVVGFDDRAAWVVPMTDVGDGSEEIIQRVASLRADGGTNILAGLQAMAAVLPGDEATLKHVVLLTDGGADPSGIPELVSGLYRDHGISLSTVGVGRDAAPFLAELAELGAGRYHFAADPASVPRIFTEETVLATRAYIVEEEFVPAQASSSSILAGIDALPPLLGYVGTEIKPAAQMVLMSGRNDPVLAIWQYGLGRSVAWTSDASGRWAQHWITWEQFPRFWSQAVRYTINEQARSSLDASVASDGDRAHLAVDARDSVGDTLNALELEARVVGPDGTTQVVRLPQTAPGRYEGEFVPTAAGAYLISMSGTSSASSTRVSQTDGWVVSYSPEYGTLQAEPSALARIAAIGQGGLLPFDQPAQVFAHDLRAEVATRPLWPELLAVAMALLPVDIAVRRLTIGRADLLRARRWLRERVASRSMPSAPARLARSTRLSALMRAKARADVTTPATRLPASELAPKAARSADAGHSTAGGAILIGPDRTSAEESDDGETSRMQAAAQTSTAASLLARKRQRQKQERPE